jgi:hypothetical protein
MCRRRSWRTSPRLMMKCRRPLCIQVSLAASKLALPLMVKGRLYLTASEQSAIYYVDTLQLQVIEDVNGVPAGGSRLVESENYVVKTFVRSGLVQHADLAAILDALYVLLHESVGVESQEAVHECRCEEKAVQVV